MNLTAPVFQAQRSNETLQPCAAASAGSQATHANSQDFAGALNDAGSKPTRKNVTSKHRDPGPSGGQLPPPGNQSPLARTPPPPARTDAAPTNQNGAATVAGAAHSDAAGPNAAAGANTAAGANAAAGATPGNTPGAAPNAAGATLGNAPSAVPNVAGAGLLIAGDLALPAAIAPAPGTSAAPVADSTPDGAAGQAVTGPSMPHASPVVLLSAAGAPTPSAHAAAVSMDAARAAKSIDGKPIDAPSEATGAAATSAAASGNASSVNSATAPGGPASLDTDAATQAVMAAAAQATSGAPTDSSSSDDSSTPDTDLAAQGVAGPNALTDSAAAGASPLHASEVTSAAVMAATATSIAQAISASASAGAADKHSRGGGLNSSISGASNDGAAGAAQLMSSSASTSPSETSPAPTLNVSAGVDTAEFGQGVADRVSLMMDSNLTSAKLQVNPPALGPIEVRIALQAGHAQVWFTSHSAVTRDALESTAPKLREMLGAQGFAQVSVDISQRSFQERSPQSKGYRGASAIASESSAPVQTPSASARLASGLLDAYA
jgi:flagellar hook-length control protein FliK